MEGRRRAAAAGVRAERVSEDSKFHTSPGTCRKIQVTPAPLRFCQTVLVTVPATGRPKPRPLHPLAIKQGLVMFRTQLRVCRAIAYAHLSKLAHDRLNSCSFW